MEIPERLQPEAMSGPRKKRKRFRSAEKTLAEIESTILKKERLNKYAEQLEAKEKALLRRGLRFAEEAGFAKLEAEKTRRQVVRIDGVRLPYLRDKLAEFRTMMLPGIDDGDISVQA
jgi:hypothetical protein